jgi:hypothetical protein
MLALLLAFVPQVQVAPQVPLERVDRAIGRGMKRLASLQADDGSFEPEERKEVCRVALTSMALWALGEPEALGLDAARARKAAEFLVAKQTETGGIYEPSNGLPVYTSGVAARALRTLGNIDGWPELGAARAKVELFVYRSAAPESFVDAADVSPAGPSHARAEAQRLLAEGKVPEGAARRALEFLARCDVDLSRSPARLRQPNEPREAFEIGAFDYEDLLPMVYLELTPEQQIVLRARKALVSRYTPERNPDLTARYGEQGFLEGKQGKFYYWLNVARTMTTLGESEIVTPDGVRHDWASEIAAQILAAQRGDGAWVNPEARWWEGEPGITTAYAVLALKLCRKQLARGGPR